MNPENGKLREAFLTSRLDELKGEMQALRAPEILEAKLAAAFRARRPAPGRPRLWWMPPLALAATVALVSWTMNVGTLPPGPSPKGEGSELALTAADTDAGPFLALRPLERIALEPGATVVRTEFPRALLAEWGLPVSPERAGEPVRAEMLYSSRGEPIAVRLLD
jgi:hypothetical protein